MYFEIYKDHANQWRWSLIAANHKKIANAGEGYFNRNDALHAINLVASSSGVPIKERQRNY